MKPMSPIIDAATEFSRYSPTDCLPSGVRDPTVADNGTRCACCWIVISCAPGVSQLWIEKAIDQPLCQVGSREGICEKCKQPLSTETTCEIDSDSALADRSLSSLGVPDYDIVKVAIRNGDKIHFAGQ